MIIVGNSSSFFPNKDFDKSTELGSNSSANGLTGFLSYEDEEKDEEESRNSSFRPITEISSKISLYGPRTINTTSIEALPIVL